jgi:arylsulfatase A-like enzyme
MARMQDRSSLHTAHSGIARADRRAGRVLQSGLKTALAACVGVATAACSQAPRGPNVLLITIDTLRADRLGCYGYAQPTSPEIDRFASTAAVFDAAQSSSSWTLPSLSSIHTSLYSSTHGCDKIEQRLEPEFTTLAETLRDAGWDTAMVACHIFLSAQYGLQQGFTHVDDTLVRTAGDASKAISSPGVSERGLAFLEAKAATDDATPWFLWLHYFDPHDEYLVHPGFSEPFGTASESERYDGEIAFTDHHVGRVLRRLEELGLGDDTLVILTSDHGEEFGEHGFDRHGYSLYEAAVRIPLVVRAPGRFAQRVADVVSNVDLMPTVLELGGIRLDAVEAAGCRHGLEGRSLVPALEGRALEPRDAVCEVRWHAGQDMRGLRSGTWKVLEHRMQGEDERELLFDLASDPLEQNDRIAGEAARAAALRDALLHRIGRALEWSRCYPLRAPYAPSPGDLERLTNLGYAGRAAPPGNGSAREGQR